MDVAAVPDADRLRDHWWWRPGWHADTRMLTWILSFEGETAVHRMAEQVQESLRAIPALEPVPVPWLHLTLTAFGDVTEVSDDCVRQAINAAHEHLAGVESLPLDFSRVVVYAESVVLVPDASPALGALRDALAESVREVRGTGAPTVSSTFAPHVSVAYVHRPARGLDVVEALAHENVDPLPGVHPTLSLVEMTRSERLYRWRQVSAFPL